MNAYVDAVIAELKYLANQQPIRLHTIYFGGGTPSLLSPTQIGRILDGVCQHMLVESEAEITLEANPGTIDQTYFEELRATGVNRLSMGMQSAHQTELTLFGRLHTVDAVPRALADACAAGFDNISLDLIYGVPHQTRSMWQESLDYAIRLAPNHFSLYALILEPGTEITRRIKYGELPSPDDDLTADMYDDATQLLGAAGYDQYELSSWGRPSAHNLQYWRNLPYLGVGAGAHGYTNRTRTVNAMRPEAYIQRLTATQTDSAQFPVTPATIKHEYISDRLDLSETLFMGLRLLHEGVCFDDIWSRYKVDLRQTFSQQLQNLAQQKLLTIDESCMRLTSQARLVSNVVFREFLDDDV